MPIPIRVLIIEDSPADAELMVLHLTEEGFQLEWQRVQTEADYLAALKTNPDLILADWHLPQFGGLRALKLMDERGLDIPFIIVSGSIGEEAAIEAMRSGASDYVLKDRPARLGQAVQHALEDKRLRQARKQAERALNEAEARYRALVEQIPVVAYTDSAEQASHTVYISPRIEEVFGCTPEEWLADDDLWLKIMSPDDRDRVKAANAHANGTGEPFNVEYRIVKKNGQTRWIHDQAVLVRDDAGKPLFWQGVLSDITERKQAEETLRKGEEQYRVTFENTGTATVLIDKDATISLANAEFERLSEYPKNEIVGKKKWTDFVVKEDLDRMLKQHELRRKDPTAALKHYEFRFVTQSGEIRDILLSIDMIPDTQTSVASLLDITERKRVEEALRDSEERATKAFRSIPEALVISRLEDGKIVEVNNSWHTVFGYSREEVIGKSSLALNLFADPADRQRAAALIREQGFVSDFELQIRQKSGALRTAILSVEILEIQGEQNILTIVQDITERKQAEEALRLRMEQLVALNQASQAVTASLDLDQVLTEIMSLAGKVVGSEYTSVVLVDEAGHMSRGVENMPGVLSIERRARQRGFTSWILRTHRPAVADEIGKDGAIRSKVGRGSPCTANPSLVEKGIKSFVGLPLVVKDHIVGVLYLHSLHPGVFGDQLPLLTTFANQAAIAIEKARLYDATERELAERKLAEEKLAQQTEELHRRNEELARLYRASGSLISGTLLRYQDLAQTIVETVQQEFGQSNCSLLVVQKDSNDLVRLVASGAYADQVEYQNLALDGPGLVPLAIRTGKVVDVGDVHSAPDYVQGWDAAQSELAIPLKVGSEVIGAIDVQSSEPNAFSPDDERLMTVFAERAALALEHSRLNAQIETRLQQLTALRTVDMAISGSFDINLTLGILLDQVIGQLGVHAADILAFNAGAQKFTFACERGFRTQLLHHTQLRFGVGYAWRAIRERRVIVVPDIQVEPDGLQRTPDLSDEQFVAYLGMPLIAKGQIKGVLEVFHREPIVLEKEWYGFLEMLAGQAAIAIDNAELFDRLQRSNADLTMAYDSTLEGWASALELRDKETEGHTRRVTELTIQLARALGVKENSMVHIYRGALLHDIGKVGVPDSIVLKPGPLTEDEWTVMRKHPQYAYDMLSPIAYLRLALDIPYCHHEKWDGTGYPRGLKGEQIPLAARIFAVVDVWDALTSDRPYRKAWTETKARQYIREQVGLYFDPQVVQAFLNASFEKR